MTFIAGRENTDVWEVYRGAEVQSVDYNFNFLWVGKFLMKEGGILQKYDLEIRKMFAKF